MAFAATIGGVTAKRLPGQFAIRSVKVLSGVTEVFATASVIEGTGSSLINGGLSGDFSGAVVNISSEVMNRATGLDKLPSQIASKISEKIIDRSKFKAPCEDQKK